MKSSLFSGLWPKRHPIFAILMLGSNPSKTNLLVRILNILGVDRTETPSGLTGIRSL